MPGEKKLRPFPAHSSRLTTSADGNFLSSSMVRLSGDETSPATLSRQAARSTLGRDMWLRTKKRSIGVIQESKASSGISKSSGRAERTIISRLGRSAALDESTPASALANRKKRRREIITG